MRRFAFRLEKVMRWKRYELDLVRAQLSEIRAGIVRLSLEKEEWESREMEERQALSALALPVVFLHMIHSNLLFSRQKKEACKKKLVQKVREEEDCLHLLHEKWKEKEVLEKLKAKRKEEYWSEEEREERKFLDDLRRAKSA